MGRNIWSHILQAVFWLGQFWFQMQPQGGSPSEDSEKNACICISSIQQNERDFEHFLYTLFLVLKF